MWFACSQAADWPSLSSWRAWIEIYLSEEFATLPVSLSSWRAWIEICDREAVDYIAQVALLMESVD